MRHFYCLVDIVEGDAWKSRCFTHGKIYNEIKDNNYNKEDGVLVQDNTFSPHFLTWGFLDLHFNEMKVVEIK